MLENDVATVMKTFSETEDYFGSEWVVDLIKDGWNIDVTNENKIEYLLAVSEYKLYLGIKA